MKKILLFLPLFALATACDSTDEDENSKENQEIVIGDPGKAYDDVKLLSLEDRVAYSVGYNSTEDAREWLDSKEFSPYFVRAKTRDGFFKGIEFADSVTAQEYNSYLMIYFQNQGSFDTTSIKPTEASYYMGYLRGYELRKSFEFKNIYNKLSLNV